jgi:hypothetical protein
VKQLKRACPAQRGRGAPKGNKNALKHGYYSQAFNKSEKLDFNLAIGLEGITEEIALLRFEIKKAVTSDDIHRLIPLSKAAYALEKLIRTHHRLYLEKQQNLHIAMENVIRNVLFSLGPEAIHLVITAKYPDMLLSTNQKTNTPKNEPDKT